MSAFSSKNCVVCKSNGYWIAASIDLLFPISKDSSASSSPPGLVCTDCLEYLVLTGRPLIEQECVSCGTKSYYLDYHKRFLHCIDCIAKGIDISWTTRGTTILNTRTATLLAKSDIEKKLTMGLDV